MASKRRNTFYENKKQETTEIERRYFFLPGGERSNEAPIPISIERLSPEYLDLLEDDETDLDQLSSRGHPGGDTTGYDTAAAETSSSLVNPKRSGEPIVDNTKEETDDIAQADIELLKTEPKSSQPAQSDATENPPTATSQSPQESS
ncbi:hypothetical protein AAG570_003631 [Ranatra chinensis]|uniref:Uncharacterized protein n=1 Tax=Ranatra chinensis TaxID=642074 RepID=A0ABD0Y4V0_9HEMI